MKKQLIKQGKRKCYWCKNIFELTEEFFYKQKSNATWLSYRCIWCEKIRNITRNRLFRWTHTPKAIYSWCVYVLKCNDYYKIWCCKSKDVTRRLKEIIPMCPIQITIHKILHSEDVYKLENYYHRKFKSKRVHFEWFLLNDDDIKAIV